MGSGSRRTGFEEPEYGLGKPAYGLGKPAYRARQAGRLGSRPGLRARRDAATGFGSRLGFRAGGGSNPPGVDRRDRKGEVPVAMGSEDLGRLGDRRVCGAGLRVPALPCRLWFGGPKETLPLTPQRR
jgi:hypothetical protein